MAPWPRLFPSRATVITIFDRSGFHSAPNLPFTNHPHRNVRHSSGRVSYIRQPTPRSQWLHQAPLGFSSAGTPSTLQQSVQPLHDLPGSGSVGAATNGIICSQLSRSAAQPPPYRLRPGLATALMVSSIRRNHRTAEVARDSTISTRSDTNKLITRIVSVIVCSREVLRKTRPCNQLLRWTKMTFEP
jgi:hypothetical protein